MGKTLGNTTASQARENVKDLQTWGNPDMWKLICKAWSEDEDWMKSTKAMEIPGVGCLVQVTTQNEELPSESVVFVSGIRIEETKDEEGNVTARQLVKA
jgi:hypothetical protein